MQVRGKNEEGFYWNEEYKEQHFFHEKIKRKKREEGKREREEAKKKKGENITIDTSSNCSFT